METVKKYWAKVVAVFDWAAGYVAAYPKTSLGVMLALAVKAVFSCRSNTRLVSERNTSLSGRG